MPRLSFSEMTTYRWTFEEDVLRYQAAGIEAIGVWRQKLSDYGEEKGIELLTESGLAVSNLQWAGGFTGSDGRSYKDCLEDAQEALHLAQAMQAGCLIVHSGARNGHTRKHSRRLLHDALCELTSLAETLDVTLAIEPMHPACGSDWTFLTELGDALDLIDSISSPRVGLVLDTYHLGYDPGIVEIIPSVVDRIVIVHLGDGRQPPDSEQNRCRLGDGQLPLHEIVSALCEAGYDGDFEVELMGEEIELAPYQQLITHSQAAFDGWMAVR